MDFFGKGIILSFLLLTFACNEKKIADKEPEGHPQPPNVILIMTDDQGIGDLGCHGNPWIKTPNLDQFYSESVRLTNFHVSPMCTPTRAALMTGLYPINNGVWATYKGRDVLHSTTVTMPQIFKSNDYNTGFFGKWHLGDNYPSRPSDRGFDVAVHHSSGGVGELSDYWGNDYFDDTYLVNDSPQKFEGYCTDVWFDEAIKFIKAKKDKPFFIYLPTNAPHTPLYVDEKYAEPYDHLVGDKIPSAEFYGMLANIDENFGKLDAVLKELGLAENTILIFCTDNGSASGLNADYSLGYNQGFRGKKTEKLEGGHRVPFFIRWPQAGLDGGKDINDLTAHVDLLPTLARLCNMELPDDFVGDGIDLSNRLMGKDKSKERTVFVHHRQDFLAPEPVIGTCLAKGDWRLLDGEKLYNIKTDRKQLNNVAQDHPEIVAELLAQNATFIAKSKTRMEYQEFAPVEIGSEEQQVSKLTIQHAIGDDGPIWKQEEISAGQRNRNAQYPIKITKSGKYRISCMRWPVEADATILGTPKPNPNINLTYKTIYPESVIIELFGKAYEKKIGPEDKSVDFVLDLDPGKTMLETNFIEGSEAYGVYYTYIELLN